MRESGENEHSVVERLVGKDLDEQAGIGSPLSRRARQSQRSVESYLKGGGVPRWMERIGQIDTRTARELKRLERARAELREACAGDRAAFAERWTAFVHEQSFAELNELVEQHNEWYPIERQLPVNPVTGEYVRVGGRSYRREPLTAARVLAQLPPR